MKILPITILIALFTVTSTAIAIEQEGGIRLMLGAPTGEFGDAVDNPGIGGIGHYGLRPQPSLTFGAGLNFMIYGSETKDISLPLVEDFELNTSNNIAGGFLFAQWRPLTGAVQPYVEARVGLNYLWTESKLQDEDWWDDDDIASKTNFDDIAPFWSGGGGLLIQVSEGDEDDDITGVFLDFKATYLQGGQAEYLTEGDISIVNDVPVFEASESETDLITYEIGVVLTF